MSHPHPPMTSTALPDDWRDLVAGYVLDDLTAAERTLVTQWVSQYPEVAVELDALQETWGCLPNSLVPEPPPALLRDRVLAAVQPVPTTTTDRPPLWRRWGWLGLGAGWAVTAVALGTVALENQRLRQDLRQVQTVVASFSRPENQLYTLTGTPSQPRARGRLIVDPQQQTALIITSELPPLAKDQAYRLWAVAGQKPIFCGQFNPNSDQTPSQWLLPNSACGQGSVQMLVTAEAANDPPVPAGPLVLQSQS